MVVGVISIILAYTRTLQEDQLLLRKFGNEHKQYLEDVPRTNVLSGIYRRLKRT